MNALLDLARTVALEGAELAARRRAEGVEVAATKSSIVDVVTAADREVEQLVRDRLAAARPDDGFFGEESGEASGTSGLTWVVDPIDGTVNYLYGIPSYAVSIAVVEGDPAGDDWSPVAGCVVAPALGEVYTAIAGEGSWLGEQRLVVPPAPPIEQALIATGFSYLREVREFQGGVVAGLLPQVRDVRRIGSAALDLCSVATGRADAYYERSLKPWDHAAAELVAREAGAIVTGMGGARAGRNAVLAAAPALLAELEPRLADLGFPGLD